MTPYFTICNFSDSYYLHYSRRSCDPCVLNSYISFVVMNTWDTRSFIWKQKKIYSPNCCSQTGIKTMNNCSILLFYLAVSSWSYIPYATKYKDTLYFEKNITVLVEWNRSILPMKLVCYTFSFISQQDDSVQNKTIVLTNIK